MASVQPATLVLSHLDYATIAFAINAAIVPITPIAAIAGGRRVRRWLDLKRHRVADVRIRGGDAVRPDAKAFCVAEDPGVQAGGSA